MVHRRLASYPFWNADRAKSLVLYVLYRAKGRLRRVGVGPPKWCRAVTSALYGPTGRRILVCRLTRLACSCECRMTRLMPVYHRRVNW